MVSESGSICFNTVHTNSSTVKSSGMNEYTLIKKIQNTTIYRYCCIVSQMVICRSRLKHLHVPNSCHSVRCSTCP